MSFYQLRGISSGLFRSGFCDLSYNLEKYWVFGLFPSSGILENRKHDVSEIGSVSILR
jgi:hypothetical protein